MNRVERTLARLVDALAGGPRANRIGLVAEYRNPDALLRAVWTLRERGCDLLDAYVPYRVEGLADALGTKRSRIPWLIGLMGFGAAGAAYLLMWWINVVAFPLNVGGRPLHAALSFIPITFETGILVGGTTAFIAVMVIGGMPRLWDPVFEVEGFGSATVDGYWVGVDRRSAGFRPRELEPILRGLGAARVAILPDDNPPDGDGDGHHEAGP